MYPHLINHKLATIAHHIGITETGFHRAEFDCECCAKIYLEYLKQEKEAEQEIVNSEQTEEEKVIELVRNEYGTNEGVNFTIANKEGNIYHVSVIDSNTTAVLAWYNVDIESNTVTQQ